MPESVDAVVVGSGPNGLSAAITIAQAGRSVVVLEANETVGGGARSAEVTEPGFVHDLASAIHPLGLGSPFFDTLPLREHGLEWVIPEASVAHPLDGGEAAIAWRDMDETAAGLGMDADGYHQTYRWLVRRWQDVTAITMGPLLRIPRHPLLMARMGLTGAPPATSFARRRFATTAGRALFAGHVAHSLLPLTYPFTTTFGLILGASAHTVGWGFPRGGAQSLVEALASHLRSLGGEIRTTHPVRSLADLPPHRAAIFSLTPGQVAAIAGDELGVRSRRRLAGFRYGPGAFKIDFALDGPIPWANPDVARAATVHVGGTLDEIAVSEAQACNGREPDRPFVLLAQHSLFDDTRSPAGRHTAWAYCHVPNGSTADMTGRIEAQIERFAPGFRDTIIAKRTWAPADLERSNANLVGGDVAGGSNRGTRVLFRPRLQPSPYATGNGAILIGSASTSPGAGVHGMSGHLAARRALDTVLA